MSRRLICFILSFILFVPILLASSSPKLYSEGAILIEPSTNTILYAKNADKLFYPASTTKLLTSIILANTVDPNTILTKTKNSILNVPKDSSHIGLNVGDKYTMHDGLYAILMESDNFVCYDSAVKAAGSVPAFADKMNSFAKQIGAVSSHFVNPHGYHNPNHYTTPYDLSQIARKAFENATVLKVAGTDYYDFTVLGKNRSTISLTHTAALFDKTSPYYNKHVIAAKTGFHTPAKRTLVAKAHYDNIDLIGVVMKSDNPHQFEDMNALFAFGSENYSLLQTPLKEAYVINHSYSPWAKPAITFALDKGWIKNSARSYGDSISRREFLTLLGDALPEIYRPITTSLIHYNGDSIYLENNPATLGEIASVCDTFLERLNVSSCHLSPVSFMHYYQLSGANLNAPFSYEQAICIVYRLYKLIENIDGFTMPKAA